MYYPGTGLASLPRIWPPVCARETVQIYIRIFTVVLILSRLTFATAAVNESLTGVQFGKPHVHRYIVGIIVRADGGDCQQLLGTVPVPDDWPGQQVSIVDEEFSLHIQNIQYGKSTSGLSVMQVSIPLLRRGQVAKALVTYEITRRLPTPPTDTTSLRKSNKVPRKLRQYLGPSPFIEIRNSSIRRWLRKIEWTDAPVLTGVEAIYDAVQQKVSYQPGKLKGAARSLKDGNGNYEDITSLFIALCRIKGIPARTVWVPDQCYAEFYLENDQGDGHWIPCQLKDGVAFGTTSETGPILQKGDNFKVTGQRKSVRFVPETLTGSGRGQPRVTFVRQLKNTNQKANNPKAVSEPPPPQRKLGLDIKSLPKRSGLKIPTVQPHLPGADLKKHLNVLKTIRDK